MHSPKSPGGEIDPAAEGQFWVGGELRDLNPPVDWSEEPYAEGDEYAFFLNCFIFADTVLVTDASEDLFERILEVLAGIYLDWIEQNPQVDHPNAHKYAWYDHAAAARLVHLAHLLREAVRPGSSTASSDTRSPCPSSSTPTTFSPTRTTSRTTTMGCSVTPPSSSPLTSYP